jgi:hypothetical protein
MFAVFSASVVFDVGYSSSLFGSRKKSMMMAHANIASLLGPKLLIYLHCC